MFINYNIYVTADSCWPHKHLCMLSVRSFAESCFFLNDGNSVRCDCKEGYVGERCERCAAGYYGQPEVLGKYEEMKLVYIAQILLLNLPLVRHFMCEDSEGGWILNA